MDLDLVHLSTGNFSIFSNFSLSPISFLTTTSLIDLLVAASLALVGLALDTEVESRVAVWLVGFVGLSKTVEVGVMEVVVVMEVGVMEEDDGGSSPAAVEGEPTPPPPPSGTVRTGVGTATAVVAWVVRYVSLDISYACGTPSSTGTQL